MILSIIIVNYNVKFFLEQCLCSVKKAIANIEAEIFVVDNNSADGSVDYLQPKFPSVKFICNKDNPGFGKANNQALTEAKGKYILFLNPDTIVGENTFHTCIDFFERHSDAGAIGVYMIDGSGTYLKESKRGFTSPWVSFCKLTGLTSFFPHSKLFSGY
ncbi:MAG: glycosyltransferase [Bacteroidetes bacterium]|nr:glycosyltransferase [Bacteroidota bacterium]